MHDLSGCLMRQPVNLPSANGCNKIQNTWVTDAGNPEQTPYF